MSELRSLSVAGFKSIQDETVEFGRVNVLIGANGAGKSNLVSFFQMLGYSMGGSLQLFVGLEGGAASLLHRGPKATPRISATLVLQDDEWRRRYHASWAQAPEDKLVYTAESVIPTSREGPADAVVYGAGHKESALASAADDGDASARATKWFLDRTKSYHFHDTSPEAGIRGSSSEDTGNYLRSRGENLAAFLYRLRNEQRPYYERIVRTISQVAPFFQDFVLEPEDKGRLLLRWKSTTALDPFGPHQLSDGTLRFMAMAALFLQPEGDLPRFIVLDEPELGLHPFAVNVLAGMIQQASESCQVLLATQSPLLLDHFAPEDVIVAELVSGESRFRRPGPERLKQWLEDYTLSELWEKNVLGGRPS